MTKPTQSDVLVKQLGNFTIRFASESQDQATARRNKVVADAMRHIQSQQAEIERLHALLKTGERFVDACFSAWSCGEPEHRVKTMLDHADEFRAALQVQP